MENKIKNIYPSITQQKLKNNNKNVNKNKKIEYNKNEISKYAKNSSNALLVLLLIYQKGYKRKILFQMKLKMMKV
jgi:hypothetical protein